MTDGRPVGYSQHRIRPAGLMARRRCAVSKTHGRKPTLSQLEHCYQRAFESAPFGMSLISARPESLGRYIFTNQAYSSLTGYAREELTSMDIRSIIHPDDAEQYAAAESELADGAAYVELECRICRRDGVVTWIRQRRSLIRDDEDRPLYFLSHSEDVSQRLADQAALAHTTERLQQSFENAPIGMALLSIDPADPGRYLQVNRALVQMTGYRRDQLLTLRSCDITHPDDLENDAQALQRLIERELESYEVEKRLIRADGQVVWCSIQRSLVHDSNGWPLYCVSQAVNVTERKRVEQQLLHLADHDGLTHLLNRRGFARTLRRHLAKTRRDGRRSAVLLIGLDRFKYVNDTLGYAVGDKVLRAVAAALVQLCPASDTLARLGGDEFAVILPELDATGATHFSNDLLGVIREAAGAESVLQVHASASVGIILLDGSTRMTTQEVLGAADIAMYQAKEAGRDRVQLAESTTASRGIMQAELAQGQRIREALRNNGFVLYQQPIMNLATGLMDSYELLLRLLDENGNVIAPGDFLGVAERFGLMPAIDRWVVREAIRFVAEEQRAGRSIRVEVNLSGPSMTDAGILECIEHELCATAIDPTSLIFEVTETVAISSMAEASLFALRVSKLGCAFALDDFGAGFSSFYYLKHLPFDYLKIDGEFVKNLTQNASDQHIVKAIVQIAAGLGKKTIAEFVGDDATVALLAEYGVNYAQGYRIGKPRPLAELYAAPVRSLPTSPREV